MTNIFCCVRQRTIDVHINASNNSVSNDQGPDRRSLDSTEVEDVERELKTDDLAKTPEPSEDGEDLAADDAGALDKDALEDEEEKKKVPFFTYFKFLWVIINSTMVSMTKYLNRFSRDYRYIRKVLSKEKTILKVSEEC